MRLFMIIDLYVGYKEACCYGVEKVENSTIIVMESEVWYFIRNQQIGNLWRDFLNFPYFTGFPAP